jgi:hypothetical protein
MAVVILGSIKHAPKIVFEGDVPVIWPDSSLRFSSTGTLDIPIEMDSNKTYIVALRSIRGTVKVDDQDVNVEVMNIAADTHGSSLKMYGGGKFTDATDFAYAVLVPTPSRSGYAIDVGKPDGADKASLFRVRVIEL